MPLLLVSSAASLAAAPGPAAQSPALAVQAAAGLAPLAADAIRFTAVQPDGRGATIYEAGQGPRGPVRTVIDLSPVTTGWTVDARETKPVAAETLDYFRGLIDTAIAGTADPGGCAAGPLYLAEHGTRAAAGCGVEGQIPAIARGLGLADPVSP